MGVDAEIAIGVGITGGGTNTVRIGTAGGTATLGLDGSDTSWAAASDVRLKKDILDSTAGLAFVNELRPVTFKWNVDGSDGEGFIAHEAQAVIPVCVNGEKDAVDDEGEPKYQGMDTSFLVATLTAAIQEQQTTIEALEARITALE